ncbi:uncharacterized protein LOC143469528 [Clavelina lepadiformis]|uniref:THD domain-containing protein n=1 Tax=Clavelina lepadiformis TaxID=159417 RepID=A0ABP0F7A5_CLALP
MSKKEEAKSFSMEKSPELYPIVERKSFSKRKHSCFNIAAGIFLLAFVVLLVFFNLFVSFKVYQLEQKVIQLEQKTFYDFNHKASGIQSSVWKNILNDRESGVLKNEAIIRVKRSNGKRRGKGNCRRCRSENCVCRDAATQKRPPADVSCHLAGVDPSNIENGHHFVWLEENHKAECTMMTVEKEGQGNRHFKQIRITQPGVYLVYAQATFIGSSELSVGFKTVSLSEWDVSPEILMTTVRSPSIDVPETGYHSGLFRFDGGEYLEVQAITVTQNLTVDDRSDYTFFGAVLLHQ